MAIKKLVNQEWQDIEVKDLQDGDVVRILHDDGTHVDEVVFGNPIIGEGNEWLFQVVGDGK